RARILYLSAVDNVDQGRVLLVVDAPHRERLEDEAKPLGEHFFTARASIDVAFSRNMTERQVPCVDLPSFGATSVNSSARRRFPDGYRARRPFSPGRRAILRPSFA